MRKSVIIKNIHIFPFSLTIYYDIFSRDNRDVIASIIVC